MVKDITLDPTKTSWDYIKKANEKRIFISMNDNKIGHQPNWMKHSIGTKFAQFDKKQQKTIWYIRTEDGRKLLDKDDILFNPVFPLFCPKCGTVMDKNRDEICFYHTKGCLNCHVKEKAIANEGPNIHEFKRKLKIIQNKINDRT